MNAKGLHKIIMDDLKHLSQEIGSYSEEQDVSSQRFRFQEITRFAQNIVNNSALAIHQLRSHE